ncbi:MAG: cell wall hydrolase [Lachnospiraceae bacterium]|nr:cell wall hydrolase [Lachnospiraceae bacterium]
MNKFTCLRGCMSILLAVIMAIAFAYPTDVKASSAQDALFMDNVEVYSTTLYTYQELKIMTCIIYAEAGNQSQKGRVAVGNVIINRVNDQRFPDTVKAVVYAKNQFTAVTGAHYKNALKLYNKIDSSTGIIAAAMRKCKAAARTALKGKSYIKDYLFYARYDNWLAKKAVKDPDVRTMRIGDHVFFDEYPMN